MLEHTPLSRRSIDICSSGHQKLGHLDIRLVTGALERCCCYAVSEGGFPSFAARCYLGYKRTLTLGVLTAAGLFIDVYAKI